MSVATRPVEKQAAAMWKRYNAYLRTPPELVVAWHDRETSARAWLVVNSFRGDAAGGGTRMRVGVSPLEVTYLAKTMELKFAVCGPPIGGGKIGIDFDPRDPRKTGVLERWYEAIRPYLRERYGTGGDLNIDEVADVIPTLARLGVSHPQEGVVRGHLCCDDDAFHRTIAALNDGVKAACHGPYGLAGREANVSDLITGYGVAASVERLYARQGRRLEGARVLLEGFGNVGASCALYLARAGARIVAIADAEKVLIEPAGLSAAEVEELVRTSEGRMLPDGPRNHTGDERARFWNQPADVFVAAALSGTVGEDTLDRLAAAGVGVIACGANQPFREVKIGSTRVQQRADRRFAVVADFVANCGMARAFGYLMEPAASPRADAIFPAVERTIHDAVDEVLDRAGPRPVNLLAASLAMSMDRIGAA